MYLPFSREKLKEGGLISKRVKMQELHIGNTLQAVCYIDSDTSRVEPEKSNTHANTHAGTHTHPAELQ